MNLAATLATISELTARVGRDVLTPDTRDGLTVPERMKESFTGWPAGSGYDRSPRRATDRDGEPLPGYSDPTGDAGTRPDRARDALRRLERHLTAAAKALEAAVMEAADWQLRDPNVIERQATEAHTEAGCASCARVAGPGGGVFWSRIYRTTTLADGSRATVCQPCYSGPDGTRETGTFPPREAVEARRDGKRWRGRAA